jgi:hypothetical protein
MHTSHVLSGGRYPVLRALALLYIIGAALTMVAPIVSIAYIYARGWGTVLDRTVLSIGALVAGFFLFVSMLAVAELLKLAIDVEHNTRMNAAGRLGAVTTVAPSPSATAAAVEAEAAAVPTGPDGRTINRISEIGEETAEAALIRGH